MHGQQNIQKKNEEVLNGRGMWCKWGETEKLRTQF